MAYTITLADGTQLTSLGLNGTSYISGDKVDESIFEDNLATMTISDGETTDTYHNMMFVAQMERPDGWYLVFTQKSRAQLQEEKIAALTAENKLLKAQNTAQTDRTDFLEDCIAEMASLVYAE